MAINPAMLTWARETSGFSLEQAAEKLAVKPNKQATAADQLAAVESGQRPVSQGLRDKAVTAYQRPLLTFYLPKLPPRGDRGEDFRTATGAPDPRQDALLDALVRELRARQQLVREIVLEENEDEPRRLAWVGSASISPRTNRAPSQAEYAAKLVSLSSKEY